MAHPYPPEARSGKVQELNQLLSTCTLQTLRQVARKWGWPIKGVAKAEIVEQLSRYMSDGVRMKAGYEALTEEQQLVLSWFGRAHSGLTIRIVGGHMSYPSLRDAIAYAEGRELSEEGLVHVFLVLMEHGLLFPTNEGYRLPGIYAEWLPPLQAPRLRYDNGSTGLDVGTGRPEGEKKTQAPFDLAALNQHAHHLLSSIEIDRPAKTAVEQPEQPFMRSGRMPDPTGMPVTGRAGLVRSDTLQKWGYATGEGRNLARFLLELIVRGGLVRIVSDGNTLRLQANTSAMAGWEEATPLLRLGLLRDWWLRNGLPTYEPHADSWNELDLGLQRVQGYVLRPSYQWAMASQLSLLVEALRTWLAGLTTGLAEGRYGLDQFLTLLYLLRPDLLQWRSGGMTWQWHEDRKRLDAAKMSFDVWRATYGRLVEAWLTGPASWLGLVQVAYREGNPVSFRTTPSLPLGDAMSLPPDLLQFPAAEVIVLRNTWQAGVFRQLLHRFTAEIARDRATTTYQLNSAAFRQALETNYGAAAIAEAFAAAGAPLREATVRRLREWEARAGRHWIDENIAVIQFGEDVSAEEIQAILRSSEGRLYEAAPRCLVALAPGTVPWLVGELRRQGYTPQVLE